MSTNSWGLDLLPKLRGFLNRLANNSGEGIRVRVRKLKYLIVYRSQNQEIESRGKKLIDAF